MVICRSCKKSVNMDEITRDGACIDCVVMGLDYGKDDIDNIEIMMGMQKDLFSLDTRSERISKMGKMIKWVFG